MAHPENAAHAICKDSSRESRCQLLGWEAGMATASSVVQLLGSYTFLSLAQMEQCWHCSEGAALPVLTPWGQSSIKWDRAEEEQIKHLGRKALTVITASHPWNSLCSEVQLNLLCSVFALSFSQAAVAHTSILSWLTEGRWSHCTYLLWLPQCCCYFALMQCLFLLPFFPVLCLISQCDPVPAGGWGPARWQAAPARGLCCQPCIQESPWLCSHSSESSPSCLMG